MQYVERCLDFTFLPVGSNDNDDLLSFCVPSFDLSIIQEIKSELRAENALNGMLLCSRKERRFFEEVTAAERYILLRYFTQNAPELSLRRLKRSILDKYLFPKKKKSRKPANKSTD